MSDPKCDGCGRRPEVYGSSWCAKCHHIIPETAKTRMLKMRNALIEIAYGRHSTTTLTRQKAREALKHSDSAGESL